jgi:hypothetical protein
MTIHGERLTHCMSFALIRARKILKGLSRSLTKDGAKP